MCGGGRMCKGDRDECWRGDVSGWLDCVEGDGGVRVGEVRCVRTTECVG